jgi:hypothetical protein
MQRRFDGYTASFPNLDHYLASVDRILIFFTPEASTIYKVPCWKFMGALKMSQVLDHWFLFLLIILFYLCPSKIFFVKFFSVTVDGRNLIFGHKRHIGTPYRGRCFRTHQIPTSCLPTVDFYTHWTYIRIFLSNYWWQKSDIWSQASYRYPISWEAFLDPSDSYYLFADFVDFYTHLAYICICTFFVTFFQTTIDDRNMIFGHKLHIGMPYCGKRFWTRQIPTSCLPT